MSTITLTVTQYIDDNKITHIDIAQVATGGISGTTEKRTLDWEIREHKDGIFGVCKGKSRWMKLGDLDEGPDKEWLSKGWLDEDGGEHVQAWVENEGNGWKAEQVSAVLVLLLGDRGGGGRRGKGEYGGSARSRLTIIWA